MKMKQKVWRLVLWRDTGAVSALFVEWSGRYCGRCRVYGICNISHGPRGQRKGLLICHCELDVLDSHLLKRASASQ